MKALIAIKSLSIRKTLERVLQSEGIGSDAVASAKDALAIVSEDHDIVIADAIMPAMTGFELCQQIKAQAPLAPVLLLSNTLTADLERQAMRVGAEPLIQKPFSSDDLMSNIKQALGNIAKFKTSAADASTLNLVTEEQIKQSTQAIISVAQETSFDHVPPSQLAGLLNHPSILAASLIDTQSGQCITSSGNLDKDLDVLANYANTLTAIANNMGESLNLNTLNSLQLHFEGMSFVTTRVNEAHVLLLCLEDDSSMGIVDYLIRKYVSEHQTVELNS